ncbi:hypothetical protein U8P76_32450 (plasmid) [Rhizobium johnstonii]|uniref:hypothetical protein n=1 Tax=Rhizobium TaxID=379 RepID=UPI001031A8A7|nr:hypothetical protein [Rhizobium leguminosarum]WSG98576.1 hypothetical protein U8P76_32450 [Rhizobium johnstonii]NEI01750.1 hypothetical protein [Rhizobium leguminosarum]NEJ42785.1 hypothetical protein [Rhizobium leguminosarum]NEJ49690.1 hypothetical protein [Rhizobium leguminosarum]TBH48589.1 hypothetical protein ELG62_32960 [Rhizobium leguminosarum]
MVDVLNLSDMAKRGLLRHEHRSIWRMFPMFREITGATYQAQEIGTLRDGVSPVLQRHFKSPADLLVFAL